VAWEGATCVLAVSENVGGLFRATAVANINNALNSMLRDCLVELLIVITSFQLLKIKHAVELDLADCQTQGKKRVVFRYAIAA
jgi:hypothetical protein